MLEFTSELKTILEQQVRDLVGKGQNQANLVLPLSTGALQILVDTPTDGWDVFIETQTLTVDDQEHSYFVGVVQDK